MFLLENKLQSFYEEIKKLNEVTFKIKDEEENHNLIDIMKSLKNKSLDTNTYGLTEGETNMLSEKSNPYPVDSGKIEYKKIEINKILIQNPNKSKVFNGKNENDVNKKNNCFNSPSETIIKCDYGKKRKDINSGKDETIDDGENISEYNLVSVLKVL